MARALGMSHIGLFVEDIERTMDFYSNALGVECVHKNQVEDENGDTILIWFGKLNNLTFEFVQLPTFEKRVDGWFDHVSFDVDDIDEMKAQLESKNIAFETEEITTWLHFFERGDRWIMFRGPDGERLEINQRL